MEKTSCLPLASDMVVYRGEFAHPDSVYAQSRGKALYFGPIDVANCYAERVSNRGSEVTPRIYPAVLVIERPFINEPTDPFLELSHVEAMLGTVEARRIAIKFRRFIEETDQWTERLNASGYYSGVAAFIMDQPQRLSDLYFQTYRFLQDDHEVELLIKAGFDGAIHAGSGHGSAERPEYCVFDSTQVRYVLAM